MPSEKESSASLLIIINFHWVKYQFSSFIRNRYLPKFLQYFNQSFDVVLTGPRTHPQSLVIGNTLPKKGHYSYYSMPYIYHLICEQRSCNYTGFLFMNDDSYIDPLFLKSYDLSHSWSEPSEEYDPVKQPHWLWPRRRNNKGIKFHDAYNSAMAILSKDSFVSQCHFENVTNRRKGFSDAFYLTAKDVIIYNHIATIMYNKRAFLETASPTALWCVTQSFFDDCNHKAMKNIQTCVHLHPVKYSKRGMTKLVMKRVDHSNLSIKPKTYY